MSDHTKYRLKAEEALIPVLNGTDHVCVVACGKCFREFQPGDIPELDRLTRLVESTGKHVTGAIRADFLCSDTRTLRALQDTIPEGTESVFVISCGLGVQTVAGATALPVFAACDSVREPGHYGMALTDKACGACVQCYLNVTGGICPVVDCSKSLLNGPCGGAKAGRCEADPDKECAWEKIYRRLEKQGRLEEFLAQPVQLRDYSAVDHKTIREYVKSIRRERLDGFSGGVHPLQRKKLSGKSGLVRFPDPDTVVIPLSMHTGKPAVPLVKTGDRVKVGQKIGAQDGRISAPVHASVSGTVIAVEPRSHPVLGPGVLSVVIRNDGLNTADDSVQPSEDIEALSPEEIVDIVKDKGITGMGGAGFPTHVKLMPGKPIDTVLLNGCECEPMLTADHTVMLHFPDDVLYGLRAIMKAVSAPRGIIAIEDNKPDALALLREKAKAFDGVEVFSVRTRYPQGAEKMLIRTVLGRSVPVGGLPADVGAVVSNVSTAKAVSDAIRTGMPPVERIVCVSGEEVRNPGTFLVRIGTSIRELLAFCGGNDGDGYTVRMGGPMMGTPLLEPDVPVIKATNGIVVCEADPCREAPCIQCGRCADVCPMELFPLYFPRYLEAGDLRGLQDKGVAACIECGCCDYICPSKIPLVRRIREGKAAVRGRP